MSKTCKDCSQYVQQQPRQTVGHCLLWEKTTTPNQKPCSQIVGPKQRLMVALSSLYHHNYGFDVDVARLKTETRNFIEAVEHYMERQ